MLHNSRFFSDRNQGTGETFGLDLSDCPICQAVLLLLVRCYVPRRSLSTKRILGVGWHGRLFVCGLASIHFAEQCRPRFDTLLCFRRLSDYEKCVWLMVKRVLLLKYTQLLIAIIRRQGNHINHSFLTISAALNYHTPIDHVRPSSQCSSTKIRILGSNLLDQERFTTNSFE